MDKKRERDQMVVPLRTIKKNRRDNSSKTSQNQIIEGKRVLRVVKANWRKSLTMRIRTRC